MTKIRVGVLRGGISGEYDVSLKTGGAVLRGLPEHYQPFDILIDKAGVWHCNGLPNEPARILSHLDVVFNALHGYYGEDGKIQTFLNHFGTPYTGSRALSSALGMNKILAKEIFQKYDLRTPHAVYLESAQVTPTHITQLYRTFPQPSVIKPFDGGSSLGVIMARDFESFARGIEEALTHSRTVLIEEYIRGREGTCGVLDNFRDERYYALPPIEIIPPDNSDFFDYEAKYSGVTQEICPGNFSHDEKQEIMRMAIEAHQVLGLRHYSRSDFIVSSRGIYILETNTLPGLTDESLLPKAAQAIGCSFPQFLDHILTQALSQK